MILSKEDAVNIIVGSNSRSAMWAATVLLTAPEFSAVSAKRLKYLATMINEKCEIAFTPNWNPIINHRALSWEELDSFGNSLYKGQLNITQFNSILSSRLPCENNEPVDGIEKLLLKLI
jgi:hypothetical protein